MTPLTPEELAARAAALPRVLADVAEESGDAALAALLRSPRLAAAIAWASDEWRSVGSYRPPDEEQVSIAYRDGRFGVARCNALGVWFTRRVGASDPGRYDIDEGIDEPAFWRPLRLPSPPSEPKQEERWCEICGGDGWLKQGHHHQVDCPDCRGTGSVSPAPAEQRHVHCVHCGGSGCSSCMRFCDVCRGTGVAQPARSTDG